MVNPGDKVLVKTKDKDFEGIYITKPELLSQDEIVLKLKTGYNIGIDKKSIKDIKVIEEYKEKKYSKKTVKKNPKLPNVLIMSTGGTISSKVDYTTGGVSAEYDASDFVEMCPELRDLANIDAKKTMSIMSEDIKPSEWIQIAEDINKELKKYDGIVLTMGTDTLGYTAAALSFMIKANKPVVITAAQRSIDRGSSDAFFNLISAVNVAANWEGAGVVSCMHGKSSDEFCTLLNGTKIRKLHSSRRDAFRPVNDLEFAKVYGAGKIEAVNKEYDKRSDKSELNNSFEDKVGLIFIHPGIKKEVFDNYKNYKGIILAGTGFGHIPEDCYKAVKKLVDSGVFVGMTSQCLYGKTSSTVYSPLRRLSLEVGVVYLKDMLPETAYVKLGWVLSQKKKLEDVKELMLTNVAGEINERIDFDSFLN